MDRPGALDVRPRDREIVARDRMGHALVDRHRDPDVVEDAERVLRAELDRDVAVDRRGADELEVRVESCEHQCDGVVGPGVDVEDQLGGHRPKSMARLRRRRDGRGVVLRQRASAPIGGRSMPDQQVYPRRSEGCLTAAGRDAAEKRNVCVRVRGCGWEGRRRQGLHDARRHRDLPDQWRQGLRL